MAAQRENGSTPGARGSKGKSPRFRRLLLKQMRKMWPQLTLAALSMLGFTIADLLTPWPLKIFFDHILLAKPLPASLLWLDGVLRQGKTFAVVVVSSAIIVFALVRGLFAYAQLFLTSRVGYTIAYAIRRKLFTHLQKLSLSYHTRARSGELLTRVTTDTDNLKDVFADSALAFAGQALTIIGMFAIMFALNWKLTLVVLATFPVLCYSLYYLFGQVKVSARKQRTREGQVAARISESMAAISLVQAFGRERYEREQFVAESTETLTESIRTARLEAASARWVELISAVGIFTVVLFGSLQALDGALLPGDVLIFVTYVTGMYKPIRNLAKLATKFSKAMVSADRIREILDVEPEIKDAPNALLAPPLRGEIAFERVRFGYEDGNPILRDVSFTVRPGQQVALVGASGAGKSTITSLLLRFYDPQTGAVRVDGVDLRAYQRESFRRQIGVVLQDSILFGTTIRENITYGKPGATDAEIEEAARQAHAHEFISALPDGYDTIIGEGGSTLSGGQRQRISLARAVIKRPSILILDEPTAAVDAESANLIMETVGRLQQGKTTLVIAHHFAALERFDQILVMKHGEVVERGTHAELLARRGYYHDLYRLQGFDGAAAKTTVRGNRVALPTPAAGAPFLHAARGDAAVQTADRILRAAGTAVGES